MDRDGLGGLVPAKPGPRRAHKLTDEVIAYVQQLREQDPGLGSARLADAIAEKFAIRVHPRSVERALARAERFQKWRRAMTSTIRAVVDPTSWTGMSGCGPGRWAATPTAGGWGWRCCSSAGSPHGCGCGRRPCRRSHRPRPARAGSPLAGGVDGELVGLLASMALAVAARG